MRPLEDIAAYEELVASQDRVGLGSTRNKRVLVLQADQRGNVAARVGLDDLIEQDAARHWNHPP